MSIKEILRSATTGLQFMLAVQKRAVQIMINPDKKTAEKLQKWQERCFYIFVPAAAIAIFSDNILFETVCLIAGIIFATLIYVEKQL